MIDKQLETDERRPRGLPEQLKKFVVERRAAQLVLAPVAHAEVMEVQLAELTATARGEGGLGSTGI